ncbi:MAG: serine protease [Gammaproteobacteria bacterium HGW-Gammaproteobacteria-3]|nr:MAG: serine protease [Gammaproteobacteria bacterium HGW-Gammaproteobacteria-3]
MKIISCFILGLGLVFFAGFQDEAIADEKLPATLAGLKSGVVAVGTFMPTRNPRGVFLGTGFVVGNGSLVATNAHVLPKSLDAAHREEMAIFVRRSGKSEMAYVKQVAIDSVHDVAILKLSGSGRLPPLKLGVVGHVQEGRLYAFTGYPIGMVLGLYPVTHRGIVSAITPMAIPQLSTRQLNPKMIKRLRHPYNVFQLDATAYPGNSGSPLYDVESGEVVGIINKVFVKESKEAVLSNPSGITYAIPINHLQDLLKTLKAKPD